MAVKDIWAHDEKIYRVHRNETRKLLADIFNDLKKSIKSGKINLEDSVYTNYVTEFNIDRIFSKHGYGRF